MLNLITALRRDSALRTEILRYLVSGVTVTCFNLLCFSLLNHWLGLDRWYLSNLPAILASILLAYVLNRVFVFKSQRSWRQELLKFVLARFAVSFIFEYVCLWLLLDLLQFQSMIVVFGLALPWAKLFAQLAVVVGNYLVGKLYIFNSKED